MYEQIRKSAIYFFIICMVVVAVIVICGIWGVFTKDVIGKSFSSLAILLVSAALIGIATLVREGKSGLTTTQTPVGAAPAVGAPTVAQPDISVGRVILYVILALIAIPFIFGFVSSLTSFR